MSNTPDSPIKTPISKLIQTAPFNNLLPQALILGNGAFPERINLKQMSSNRDLLFVCADGGAQKARELGLVPQMIIGDLDSISPETLNYFINIGVKVERNPAQDNNDLEKCIRYLLRHGLHQFILVGFTGRRDDHTLASLLIAKKYLRRAQFLIHSATAEMFLLKHGDWIFETFPGQIISLFGFPIARQVITHGLRFPLKNENLGCGSRGLSNIATQSTIRIQFTGGHLLVVRLQDQQ
ncbi:MAG: thiamine diphosphokinase [Candidatus Neomarinimicrobiota bacterium]